ncbi:hypothetical protein [Stenotrophomonas sp. VV52]|uniref:hypothetical protein n=1 Tax=Stenotrophomonas sp. VV52 TaxID=2066958 RepID=UPI0011AFCC1A|nr:hypothetical protein [Stenotrophomonas sp. VV52]
MTVSIVLFQRFDNGEHLSDFMHELKARVQDVHQYADNVVFAKHEGSSRDLFEVLKTALPVGRLGEVLVITAEGIQDTSWITNGATFDWLNAALPNWDTSKRV